MPRIPPLAVAALLVSATCALAQHAGSPVENAALDTSPRLGRAQQAFFDARYEEAAAVTVGTCAATFDNLWKQCAVCPELLSAFVTSLTRGQSVARARLQAHPDDVATLFFLGKLDLNYVWLQLGTLGRKTGWSEYWEGRRALDQVLKVHPGHVRARVARGWIDYIVDTKMPRGTRWMLGGGSKRRGLLAVRQAAEADADFFTRAEARFALWDMQVRERDLPQAVATARALSRDFPNNEELSSFIAAHAREGY
jgi:hypothetical protein